ncbi:MAG: hypothetical protein GC192_04870 [Bacteroidetes bacterium]|nr:hypothetical protein [Bacteroidota bacterium]
MSVKNFLPELDHEQISARKLLERVPADQLNWQPHPKALTLGQLALHVATIPGRIARFADDGETAASILVGHPQPTSKDEILAGFEKSPADAKSVLEAADGNWESQNWSLTHEGATLMTIPRPLFLRLFMLNHWFHHRGELTTYLRTLDVKIPSVYGPSADENPFG